VMMGMIFVSIFSCLATCDGHGHGNDSLKVVLFLGGIDVHEALGFHFFLKNVDHDFGEKTN